jgi:chemotaxis protein MotB
MRDNRETPVIVVRKKVHGGGHHGGAWKVAFADFMTAMMSVFLVLWIVGQSQEVREAIAGHFSDPLGFAKQGGNSLIAGVGLQLRTIPAAAEEQLLKMRRDRLQRLGYRIQTQVRNSLALNGLDQYTEIQMVEEGLRIELLENSDGVFFGLGSSEPSPAGKSLLALLGKELSTVPNMIVIEGHTDARQYEGDRAYSNWELSTDRANAARRTLMAGGMLPEQILQVRGHADRDLRDYDDPYSPSNRRVTITVLTDYNLAAPERESVTEPEWSNR